jgi:hypothetical protein
VRVLLCRVLMCCESNCLDHSEVSHQLNLIYFPASSLVIGRIPLSSQSSWCPRQAFRGFKRSDRDEISSSGLRWLFSSDCVRTVRPETHCECGRQNAHLLLSQSSAERSQFDATVPHDVDNSCTNVATTFFTSSVNLTGAMLEHLAIGLPPCGRLRSAKAT